MGKDLEPKVGRKVDISKNKPKAVMMLIKIGFDCIFIIQLLR